MSVLPKLASSLGRRDEVHNQELAEEIVRSRDEAGIKELISFLAHQDKGIQSDSIKVLYEIGKREPGLISGYGRVFAALLDSKQTRLVWGAMTALHQIARVDPKAVFAKLNGIRAAAKSSGSVIARDHAVGIYATLASLPKYANVCLPLLIEELRTCPNNQIPMYAEMSWPVITGTNASQFRRILMDRMKRLEKDSQKTRVQRILKRIMKRSTE